MGRKRERTCSMNRAATSKPSNGCTRRTDAYAQPAIGTRTTGWPGKRSDTARRFSQRIFSDLHFGCHVSTDTFIVNGSLMKRNRAKSFLLSAMKLSYRWDSYKWHQVLLSYSMLDHCCRPMTRIGFHAFQRLHYTYPALVCKDRTTRIIVRCHRSQIRLTQSSEGDNLRRNSYWWCRLCNQCSTWSKEETTTTMDSFQSSEQRRATHRSNQWWNCFHCW